MSMPSGGFQAARQTPNLNPLMGREAWPRLVGIIS
jgi:hypothetical protein